MVDMLVQEAQEQVQALNSSHKQGISPGKYTRYMVLMLELIDYEPSSFEEVVSQQEWVDTMVDEYDSVMNNDASQVVP